MELWQREQLQWESWPG